MNNSNYWDYLCGSGVWKQLGLKDIAPNSLEIFDSWYLNDYYPYLKKYLPVFLNGNVLEIGLGFGTVSQFLFNSFRNYVGVDFAYAPAKMIRDRARYQNKNNTVAVQGDAKTLPFRDEAFDAVVAIGCLHHTGDIRQSVSEIYRVLKKGCSATIMIYNKYSFRRLAIAPLRYIIYNTLNKERKWNYNEYEKTLYDKNQEGEPPPITEYYSKKDIKNIFSCFSITRLRLENFDGFRIPGTKIGIERKLFLHNLAKIVGLDIYITATK